MTYLQAGQRLDEEAAPRDDLRAMIISPAMQAQIVDTLKGLFQSSTDIATQYESGKMGLSIGFKWSMDQNVGVNTSSAAAIVAPTMSATAGQTGNSLALIALASAQNVFKRGQIFTIGSGATGVYAVNPQSKQSTGSLRQFVVTADVTSVTTTATVPIYPSIITSGPFQTVVAAPGGSAAINIQSAASVSSPQGLAFHKDAFALGCADLPLPGGVDMAARVSDKQLGLSIRLVRAYDINTDRFPTRIDLLYGWVTLYPELACRVAS
jgi:hypothetical protein